MFAFLAYLGRLVLAIRYYRCYILGIHYRYIVLCMNYQKVKSNAMVIIKLGLNLIGLDMRTLMCRIDQMMFQYPVQNSWSSRYKNENYVKTSQTLSVDIP